MSHCQASASVKLAQSTKKNVCPEPFSANGHSTWCNPLLRRAAWVDKDATPYVHPFPNRKLPKTFKPALKIFEHHNKKSTNCSVISTVLCVPFTTRSRKSEMTDYWTFDSYVGTVITLNLLLTNLFLTLTNEGTNGYQKPVTRPKTSLNVPLQGQENRYREWNNILLLVTKLSVVVFTQRPFWKRSKLQFRAFRHKKAFNQQTAVFC